MDIIFIIGLTSPLAAFIATILLVRSLRKNRLHRRAVQQAYAQVQGLRACADVVRRRSRAMFAYRKPARNVSTAAS